MPIWGVQIVYDPSATVQSYHAASHGRISMRRGQIVLVDDGACPAGQIKRLTAGKKTRPGLSKTRMHRALEFTNGTIVKVVIHES